MEGGVGGSGTAMLTLPPSPLPLQRDTALWFAKYQKMAGVVELLREKGARE